MLREGTYDLVVGNPPYQGTSKMQDAVYVKKQYPRGKADLYAAFLERGLQLVRDAGTSAASDHAELDVHQAISRAPYLASEELRLAGDSEISLLVLSTRFPMMSFQW